MKRCIPVFFSLMLAVSCATSEVSVPAGLIAEKEAGMVIIMEETPDSSADEPAVMEEEAPAASPAAEVPESEEEDGFAVLSATAREQSAVLEVQVPRAADLSGLSVSGGGSISEIRISGNMAIVTIANLESLSDYSLVLEYLGEGVTDPVRIKTASFAGRYSWAPADGREWEPFVLCVAEAPAGSDYRYYIYIDPEDSAFPDGYGEREVRIAPLRDAGEPSLDDMRYKDAPEGYKWTNSKWNTGSMTPSRIAYVRPQETESRDEIRTLVASVALGFTAESDVRYILHEKDGRAYLIFHSSMSPDIANSFLVKNPSPGIREYEADGFWYTLERL